MADFAHATRGFYKKTRKGKVIQITREKYIHSAKDGCGYILGTEVGEEKLRELVMEGSRPHLLVLDTNVALNQIDVFESKMNAITNVVVLQTVLQEVQHLNQGVFRRLLHLMKDETRSYIFFPNELMAETAAFRVKGETPNDANDRAIRIATAYFQRKVGSVGQVFMVSNDTDNCRRGVAEMGLSACSLASYAETYLKDVPELLDLLAAEEGQHRTKELQRGRTIEHIFTPYVSAEEVSLGLKTRKYMRGTLRVRRDDCNDCYVVIHGGGKDSLARRSMIIQGCGNVNRAVDGDVVAVEEVSMPAAIVSSSTDTTTSFPSSSSAAAVGDGTLDATPELLEGIAQQKGDTQAASSSSPSCILEPLTGRVVAVIRRKWRHYAGSLANESTDILLDSGAVSTLFKPVDKKIPPIRITTRRRVELTNCRILVGIDTWPSTSKEPLGHFVRSLGADGDKDVETAVLLHEFDVPYEAFSPDVMSCLPPADWAIGQEDLRGRADFRGLPVVSIDPPGCKDIDDALHCIRLPNGHLECGVHIADVTHFVKPDSPLDKEAQHRSTSTYLVERRLDMLPSLLTTELCSLRSKEDHLAFSVVWEMDHDCNIVDVRFNRSVIHSVASLTYDEAQAMLDEHAATQGRGMDAVSTSVNLLGDIARTLRKRRIDQGALTLASPEVRFRLDADDDNNPTDVSVYALKEANALVEEFMLLANITVSKKILRHYPTLGVLRRHQPPSKEQFAPLMLAAAAVGIQLDISSSKTLSESLDRAVRADDPYFNKLMRVLSTRCMMPAQYFCSGEVPADQWWHYGLAAPVYSHFTSPIRRYADVCVHRLLAAAIGDQPLPPAYADRGKQQDLCSHMNRRHKAAQHASRASTNLHTLLYFRGKPSVDEAYILSVTADRVVVLVPKFGLEGSVVLHGLAEHFQGSLELDGNAQRLCVRQKASGEVVMSMQVLQKVTVRISVVEKDRERRLRLGLMVHGQEFYTDEDGNVEEEGGEGAMEVDEAVKSDKSKRSVNESMSRKKKIKNSNSQDEVEAGEKKKGKKRRKGA